MAELAGREPLVKSKHLGPWMQMAGGADSLTRGQSCLMNLKRVPVSYQRLRVE